METAETGSFLKSAIISLYLVLALWIVKVIEFKYHIDFSEYGLVPRSMEGLPGIFTSPFIHADLGHLTSNSVPLFISGIMLWYFFPSLANRVILFVYLITGIGVWLLARPAHHIGASGVVYGLISFLFFSGVFRKDRRLMGLSALVVFLYGSLIWGIFPIIPNVSWESHLVGLMVGILCAYIFRKQGPQPVKYAVEDEEDEPDDEDPYWEEEKPQPAPMKIVYLYKPDEEAGS